MLKTKKILLISNYLFGYIEQIEKNLINNQHSVEVLYFDKLPLQFKYSNFFERIYNFFLKLFSQDIKKKHREKYLINYLHHKHFDTILVIHGHNLNENTHKKLKEHTDYLVTYFCDSMSKVKEQKFTYQYYDDVFSFDKEDCIKYNFKFITNFYYTNNYISNDYTYEIFTIMAQDTRMPIFINIINYLNEIKIKKNIILKIKKPFSMEGISITKKQIPLHESLVLLKNTKIVLDIQRPKQLGLTFRVFEAIANHKKLISTNIDIEKYDFYHPENIYILKDTENISIPVDFLSKPFLVDKIPESFDKYSIENFNKVVFKLN